SASTAPAGQTWRPPRGRTSRRRLPEPVGEGGDAPSGEKSSQSRISREKRRACLGEREARVDPRSAETIARRPRQAPAAERATVTGRRVPAATRGSAAGPPPVR